MSAAHYQRAGNYSLPLIPTYRTPYLTTRQHRTLKVKSQMHIRRETGIQDHDALMTPPQEGKNGMTRFVGTEVSAILVCVALHSILKIVINYHYTDYCGGKGNEKRKREKNTYLKVPLPDSRPVKTNAHTHDIVHPRYTVAVLLSHSVNSTWQWRITCLQIRNTKDTGGVHSS